MPLRFDRAELPTPERTAEGYLRTTAIVARPGVLEYPRPDGTIDRELVTPEVLAESAQGLADRALTLRHPTKDGRPNGVPIRVDKSNVAKFTIGHSRDGIVINEDGSIGVPVTVTHAKGIEAIDGGMRGISPLYDSVIVDAPKIDGKDPVHAVYGRYNKIQTSRVYNSIAICPLGRGGPQCHLRADDSEAVVEIEGGEVHADEDVVAPAVEESAEANATKAALAAILERFGVATVEEAWSKINAEWSELYAKRDALSGLMALLQCDTADAVRAKVEAMMAPPVMRADSVEARAWFHTRAKLHTAAVAAKVPNPDALDDAALRKAIVLARAPILRADESDAYYAAAFDFVPVDHLASLRHDGKPAALRADEAPKKLPASRWDDAFNKPTRS